MNTETNQNKETKIEFTQESILHCIMRSATRSDIAELRGEVKADMSAMKVELKGDISALKVELKGDIAGLKAELKSDISELRHEVGSLRKDTNKYFRWIVGLMFGSFAGIALIYSALME